MKEVIRQFFIKEYRNAKGYAIKLCKDEQLAHDLVMGGFCKMMDVMNKGMQINNKHHYLFACIRSLYEDHKRHSLTKLRHENHCLAMIENDEAFAVDIRDKDQILKIFLPQLTERYQQIIYGTMQNKSTEELAREFKIEPVTVRRLRLMAIEKLKQLIGVGKYEM